MSVAITRIFSQIAGPPLRQHLPTGVHDLIAGSLDRVEYVLDEIQSKHSEYIAGVYVDFVDDASINAVSYCDGRHEFVGLHGGAGILLPILYNWLLSHPS